MKFVLASAFTLITLLSCGKSKDEPSPTQDPVNDSGPKLGEIYEIKGPTAASNNPQLVGIESHRFEKNLTIKLPVDLPLKVHTLGYKRNCGDATTQIAGPFVKIPTPEGGHLTLNPTTTSSGEHSISSVQAKAGDFQIQVYATSDKPCEIELAIYLEDASIEEQIPGYGAELSGTWTVSEIRGSYRHKSEWRFFGYGKLTTRDYIDDTLISDLEYVVHKNSVTNPDQLSLRLTTVQKVPEGSPWESRDTQNCIFETGFKATGERTLKLRCSSRNVPFFPTVFDTQTREFLQFIDSTDSSNFIASKEQLNAPIPDNSPTGVSITFDVVQDFSILDLQITAHTNHNLPGEIRLYLISPDGKKIRASIQRGSTENQVTTLSYIALTSSDTAVKEMLSATRSRGTWTLIFTDETGGDTGNLKDLTFKLLRR